MVPRLPKDVTENSMGQMGILKKKRKEKDRILIDKRRKVERTPCQILREYSAYTGMKSTVSY